MPTRMAMGIRTLTGSGGVADGSGAVVVWTPSLHPYRVVEIITVFMNYRSSWVYEM
jgi:hypothetical protein